MSVGKKTMNVGSNTGIINFAETMTNVNDTINNNTGHSDEVKRLIGELTTRLTELSKIEPAKAAQMGSDLETLSKEMASSTPRKKWYQVSLDGIKEAAEAVGKVGVPIVEILAKLTPLLLP